MSNSWYDENSFNIMGDFSEPYNHIHEQIFLKWGNVDISIIKMGDPVKDNIYEVAYQVNNNGHWEVLDYKMRHMHQLFDCFNKLYAMGMITKNKVGH